MDNNYKDGGFVNAEEERVYNQDMGVQMNKYQVIFTEESTKDHHYTVEAESKEKAFLLAEDKYLSFKDADYVSTSYSKTINNTVEEI